mgnify:FL=1
MNFSTPRTPERRRALTWGLLMAAVVLMAPGLSAQGVSNPHGELPADLDCSACHTPDVWSPARAELAFSHGSESGFLLTGAHVTTDCSRCHLELRFDEPEIRATDCESCHLDIPEGRLLQPCATCHETQSFFDVDGEAAHAVTAFPLTGAHRQATCESCHIDDVGGAFGGVETECVSCHLDDYEAAVTVDHVAGGYATDCTDCHSAIGWSDAPAFDHTDFELLGAHRNLRCASCHSIPDLEPLQQASSPDDCVACHQSDFDGEHADSGFPTTCLECHNVDTWDDADFDHGATAFPLVGAHTDGECSDCHGPPQYLASGFTGPSDCVACHQSDYDKEHGASPVPLDCLGCHTETAWTPSTFDHDGQYFPIYSGEHRQEWNSCADCHIAPADFAVVSCLTCHEHRQAKMDDEHKDEPGYTYTTAGCLACHPRGNS